MACDQTSLQDLDDNETNVTADLADDDDDKDEAAPLKEEARDGEETQGEVPDESS